VEQNGGRLEIESRPGIGTTIRVRLPTAADPGVIA
jgi:signal transduction histidine kinase